MQTKEFRTPPGMCPCCGSQIDGATAFGDYGGPSAGDFSVCINCASILMFEEGMRLRPASEDDFKGAPMEFLEVLQRVVQTAKEVNRMSGKDTPNVSRPN